MCSDEPNETNEPQTPIEPATSKPEEASSTPSKGLGFQRRTFLKAAALGTAAAAFLGSGAFDNAGKDIEVAGKRIHIGSLTALANDLSNFPCEANDFIVGEGVVLNLGDICTTCENGSATGTAIVQFPVNSTQNATRKCITLHLPDGTDIVLRNTAAEAQANSGNSFFSGSGSGFMYANIPNFPCNPTGPVCFGSANEPTRGKCSGPGVCATVAWDTTNTQVLNCTQAQINQSPPKGQCRHQQICILGFGATLSCVSGCPATCGGNVTLQAHIVGPPSTSYSLVLSNNLNNTTQTKTLTTDASGEGNVSFDPVQVSQTETFTLTATVTSGNLQGCIRHSSFTVPVTPITITAAGGTPPACAGGNTTLTASASGGGSIKYEFFEGATKLGEVTTSTGSGSISVLLGSGTHNLSVTATNSGGCQDTMPFTVTVPTAVTINSATATPPACAGGNTSLAASASGGTGTPHYVWSEGSTVLANTANASVSLSSGSHTLTLAVTDDNNCPATQTVPVTIPTPVSTSLDTGSAPDCKGNTTFTALATGGTGTYTFAWTIDGAPVSGNTGNTLAYPPNVDCNPHTISVAATDSAGCPSGNTATRTITQVVTTTIV